MSYLTTNPFLRAALRLTDCLPRYRKNAEEPKRILLAQIAHLGDVVMATSLIPPLKETFPRVPISFLVGGQSRPLLENHPDIDALYTYDHPLLTRGGRQKNSPLSELGQHTHAIDLSPYFPNAIPRLKMARIPHRIGFTSGGFGKWLSDPLPWSFTAQHLSAHLASLLTPLGIRSPEPKLHLPIPKMPATPYIVVQPFGGAPHKRWPLERWQKLLAPITCPIKVVGIGKEAERLAPNLGENLCNRLTLPELMTLIASAALFVGVDSVGGHLAAAAATPSFILFHPKDCPILWRPLSPLAETASLFEEDGALQLRLKRIFDTLSHKKAPLL